MNLGARSATRHAIDAIFRLHGSPDAPKLCYHLMIIYAVGDIHGRADLLLKLQAKIKNHAVANPGPKKIVFLGDYVDRGPDSAQVIDILMKGPPPGVDEQVCLRGNHEQMMLDANRRWNWLASWYMNGGLATKHSYDGDDKRLQDHLAWIDTLPMFHREGRYLFVHAGIVPGRDIAKQRPSDLIWIRHQFLDDQRDHGFTVVHGHTPVRKGPDVRPNRINVDTGAVYGGPLTCAVLTDRAPTFMFAR